MVVDQLQVFCSLALTSIYMEKCGQKTELLRSDYNKGKEWWGMKGDGEGKA